MIPGLIYVATHAECSCAWLGGACDVCYVAPLPNFDDYDPRYDSSEAWARQSSQVGFSISM